MQPQDPYNPQTGQPPIDPNLPDMSDLPPQTMIPDLPDAALPEVDMPYSEPPVPAVVPQPQPQAQPQPQPQPVAQPQYQHPPQQQAPPQNGDQGKAHLSHVGKKYFNLIEFDDQEVLLAEIRKHPFGLIIIFVTGGLIAFLLFAAVAAVAASGFLNSLGFGNLNAVAVFAAFLLSMFVIVITAINAHLYRNNVVFVTNEKLAQVLFITLFNRKISQLSIGDVQDVTVQQNGFLPNTIGYGTLVVETAGEQQNYTFTFVPHPYETSKIIINAHENNLKLYGN